MEILKYIHHYFISKGIDDIDILIVLIIGGAGGLAKALIDHYYGDNEHLDILEIMANAYIGMFVGFLFAQFMELSGGNNTASWVSAGLGGVTGSPIIAFIKEKFLKIASEDVDREQKQKVEIDEIKHDKDLQELKEALDLNL